MATQSRQTLFLGFPANIAAGLSTSTFSMNGALGVNWYGLQFVPDQARTLSAARTYVDSIVGSLAIGDITAYLYDNTGTNGAPGALIEGPYNPTVQITLSNQYYNWSGFSTALTASKAYWIVWRNLNAAPTVNYAIFRQINGVNVHFQTGSAQAKQNWGITTSTNSGGTWALVAFRTGLRIAYADGTYDGNPCFNTANSTAADGVYSTRESGVKFTSPGNVALKVAGVAAFMPAATGSPTGSARFGLWTGSTPANQGYTNSFSWPGAGTAWGYSYFSSPITVYPSTVVRLTLGETTQSDTSSNRYNNQEVFWDSDSNSTPLLPFDGTCVKTLFDGSNWTDTSGSLFPYGLLLDTSGEFSPSGAILSRAFLGMGMGA